MGIIGGEMQTGNERGESCQNAWHTFMKLSLQNMSVCIIAHSTTIKEGESNHKKFKLCVLLVSIGRQHVLGLYILMAS